MWHSGTSIGFHRSCSQGSFTRRGYSVRLHHRSYDPIRQSGRLLPISVLTPYTGGLCHSRIDPDCLPHLPQFNLRFLLYMPPPLPQRAVLLHASVASQDVPVFAHNAEARHPLHYSRHLPPVARRVGLFPRLQCSLYATACIVARPTGMTTCAFARPRVLLLPSLPMVGHPPMSRL